MTNTVELLNDLKSLKGPVVVLGHIKPDADCVGAALGLAMLLRSFGIEAFGMTPEPTPRNLAPMLEGAPWMPPSRDFLNGKTLVAVDCAERALLEPLCAGLEFALAIDHHISHINFAKKDFVLQATSACEIVAGLCQLAGVKVSTKIAEAIYAGFLFDTGRWWWGGIGPGSFQMGQWLFDCGVDFNKVTNTLYGTLKLGHIRLLQTALSRMEFLCDGAVVVSVLTEADFAAAGAGRYDKEGIIDTLRAIEGVQIAVLLNAEKGLTKGSTRARTPAARLDLFCTQFGGGGHRAAAGMGKGIAEPLETFYPTFKEKLAAHYASVHDALVAENATA